jgi:hypothetical protein
VSVKPVDQLQLYVGYAGGPEQTDFSPLLVPAATGLAPSGAATGPIAGADSNWRHLVDFVADFNPTAALRFLLNADYDTEKLQPSAGHNAVWAGVNLAIRYVVADPFSIVLRGEIFADKHGDVVVPAGGKTTSTVESGTLTLSYVIASHYTLMLDNRVDAANSALFPTVHSTDKTQWTSTLGVIASTH